jgi:uncharacterized protein YecA (UPF0149 family)
MAVVVVQETERWEMVEWVDSEPPKPRRGPNVEPVLFEIRARRNQPCPCGSGKKYKKCCGGNRV